MVIYFGSDHGGFELKKRLMAFVKGLGYETADLGNTELDPADDYPDYALAVAEAVAKDPGNAKGILLCRSGDGIAIAANKVRGVRAVRGSSPDQVFDSRDHLDSNALSVSGDDTPPEEAENLVRIFLETPFSKGERHVRRLKKIQDIESRNV